MLNAAGDAPHSQLPREVVIGGSSRAPRREDVEPNRVRQRDQIARKPMTPRYLERYQSDLPGPAGRLQGPLQATYLQNIDRLRAERDRAGRSAMSALK